jgi:cytochrome c oxidase subunit 4
MTETQTAAHPHHDVSTRSYFIVFGALLIFTVVSFAANEAVRHHLISPYTSFVIILSVAVVKATLVGIFFMHLIFDWGKVFIMIVPALILGPVLVLGLWPDMVLPWLKVVVP